MIYQRSWFIVLSAVSSFLFANMGCKARSSSGSASQAKSDTPRPEATDPTASDFPLNKNFLWGQAGPQGQALPLPTKGALTFCRDATTNQNQQINSAIDFVIAKINNSKVTWTFEEIACINTPNITVAMKDLGAISSESNTWPSAPLDPDNPNNLNPSSQGGGAGAGGGNPNGAPNGTLAVFVPDGAIIAGQPFISHGTIYFNSHQSVTWDTKPNSEAFDPQDVGLHEFGHAMLLNHEIHNYNDNGQTVNIMEPNSVFGRHGVNDYNYAPREIQALLKSAQL